MLAFPSFPHSRLAAACLAAGLLAFVGDARADDQSTAEELLARGRGLMRNAATLNEACRLLADSLKMWDRGDTTLNLAECHRRQGKTATAYAEFEKALSVGSQIGFSEAVQAAAARRDELATRLSRLTVTVDPALSALEGLTLELDGVAWAKERWNNAIPVDPGPHVVVARAKGYKPFEARVEIGPSKDAKTVVVALELEPPVVLLPPTPPLAPVVEPRPVWPWVVGGAGILLGVAGIASEVVSQHATSELNQNCGGSSRPSCHGPFDYNGARTRELVGYGLFVGLGSAGVIAIGVAGVRLGLASRSRPQGVSLLVSPTSLGVGGTF